MDKSPLAPEKLVELPSIAGVRLATASAEIKYKAREDLMLAHFDEGTTVAGVFTRSKTASAPVDLCRRNLVGGAARGLVVNSGNSNAFTGKAGVDHAIAMAEEVGRCLKCDPQQVFVASTGVIGEPLPIEKILNKVPCASSKLNSLSWEQAATAIMTTDTFPKLASVKSSIDGCEVIINGFAKGSGMIEPDMATMLAFIFTDAKISSEVLQTLLEDSNQLSFNSITVDSDTSTSDTCMLFATGKAENPVPDSMEDPMLSDFAYDLRRLMKDLAIQVVRDGEGASKLIEIRVSGAENDCAARVIGKSIANSPLVKTAVAGEDANWGRIVMAVGKSGELVDRDRLGISMGPEKITENGQLLEGYDEAIVNEHLKGSNVSISVEIGVGSGDATVWTCDLTHGYISINADYRS